MAFTKTNLIGKIEELELKEKDYMIYMGGSLLMHGLREETHDLDIGLTTEAYERLREHPKAEDGGFGKVGGDPRFTIQTEYGEMEFFNKGQEIKVEKYPVEGITCQSLESILEMKLSLNREKDQKDINKIKEVLKKND